jgi:hypothetical protein
MDASSEPDSGWKSAFKIFFLFIALWLVIEVIATGVLATKANSTLTPAQKSDEQAPE